MDYQIDQESFDMHSRAPHKLNFQQNLEECDITEHNPLYGTIQPIRNNLFGLQLYSNPQCGMLIFTIILTLTLEIVVLKFVFFGIHFYIGCGLCLLILYLLLSLGYSNPGFGFEEYEQMQYHLDVQGCTERCRHPPKINQTFKYFCQKCKIPTKENTRHCNMCNTCVYGYDHHCVFIGKCVGGNNFGRFKLFLFMIFSTLVYGFVSALFNLSSIKEIQK